MHAHKLTIQTCSSEAYYTRQSYSLCNIPGYRWSFCVTHYIEYTLLNPCTPLQRHRSGKYSVKNTLASVCSTLSKEAQKVYRPPSLGMGAYTPFRPPTKIWLSWKTPDNSHHPPACHGAQQNCQAPSGPHFALLYKLFINYSGCGCL